MDFDQITEQLYVGAQFEPGEWKILQKSGITANLNLRAKAQDVFDGAAPEVSLWLPTPDWDGPDVATIALGARFIASTIEAGHKIYVHCRFGAGRAPIVGAAYLVTTGMDVDDAIRYMKQQRPGFKPNGGQIENLRRFAQGWAREQGT